MVKEAILILLFFCFFAIIILGDNMDSSRSKKNDIFYLILLVFTLITMIIGITFTSFMLFTTEKEDDTRVETGSIAINYIDGKDINTYALLPISEPNLNTKYSTYKKNFAITSSGSTIDQNFDIYIDVANNEFSNNALGFILYDANGNVVSRGTIPSSGRVLVASSISLKSNETLNYTLLIWLQDNNDNQDYEQGKSFTGGFYIDAQQIKYK